MSAPVRNLAAAAIVAIALAAFAVPAAPAPPAPAPKAGAAAEAPTIVTPSALPHRVVAFYFHTTYRCATCRAIEAYSREAIESAFADDIAAGRLLWKTVNIEVKGNEHYAKDYKLYTKSLVLVNEVRGRKAEWKNLEKVWQLVQDKPKFQRYVLDETRAYLAGGS